MRFFSRKLGDKAINCFTVGIEKEIEAGIFLIRIKMSQKSLKKFKIFGQICNLIKKLVLLLKTKKIRKPYKAVNPLQNGNDNHAVQLLERIASSHQGPQTNSALANYINIIKLTHRKRKNQQKPKNLKIKETGNRMRKYITSHKTTPDFSPNPDILLYHL